MIKNIFILSIIIFFCISCENEDDASDVVVLFTTDQYERVVKSGEFTTIKIESFTIHETIEHFEVSSLDSENGLKKIFDTIPNSQNFNYEFTYLVPSFNKDSVRIELKFKATDNQGNSQQIGTSIIAYETEKLLKERSGLILYSSKSGKDDGFSLQNPSQTFITSLTDSAKIDIYAYSDPNDKSDILPREFRTNTDIEFVRNNTFDYVNATSKSIKDVYLNSKRSNIIRNIQEDDIILVGKKEKVWGVLYIASTKDDEGTFNDKYIINLKY